MDSSVRTDVKNVRHAQSTKLLFTRFNDHVVLKPSRDKTQLRILPLVCPKLSWYQWIYEDIFICHWQMSAIWTDVKSASNEPLGLMLLYTQMFAGYLLISDHIVMEDLKICPVLLLDLQQSSTNYLVILWWTNYKLVETDSQHSFLYEPLHFGRFNHLCS